MKPLKQLCLIFLIMLSAFGSIAQLTLGEATLSYVRARHVMNSQRIAFAVRDVSYLTSIGGVAFDKEAIPADGLYVSSLQLQYNSQQDDGRRFSVIINGERLNVKIYDWELVPIAKYANSIHTACFTLFGKLSDNSKREAIYENGGRILNYHPELANTLLGLRLFQLDILIFDPNSIDLPKRANSYVLGKGESAPNLSTNRAGFSRFRSTFEKNKQEYRSYLICDLNRTIRFGVRNNTLYITGTPFYYFWRFNTVPRSDQYYNQRTENSEKIVYLDGLSKTMSNQPQLFRNINPAVWDAGVKTMRFSAFFRYCKNRFPEQWKVFMAQIKRVPVSPKIETPTVMSFNSQK